MRKSNTVITLTLSMLLCLMSSCAHSDQPIAAKPVDSESASELASSKDLVSIKALSQRAYSAEFTREQQVYQRSLYDGALYSYKSDGLNVFALVNSPTSAAPESGFPVVIFGHGFHPEPKKYGIKENGVVSRPGDYYRGVPESFAERGFVVVTPDYRGHNISEGFEYTKTSYLASSYYASDVLHALDALQSLANVDLSRVYYLGHSMGGDVGLKVLLATHKFKAASLWSPVAASTDIQALYYGKYYDETHAPGDAKVDGDTLRQYRKKIDAVYSDLPAPVQQSDVDPINHLKEITTPLIVQHARNDASVPYAWSEALVVGLINEGKKVHFHTYATNNHLFNEANMRRAIERDIEFFNAHQ